MPDETEKKPAKRGNPAWIKGGRSPNPGGRPRDLGDFRERARELSDGVLEQMREIVDDAKQPSRSRVAAAQVLLDRGYGRVPLAEELSEDPMVVVVKTASGGDPFWARSIEKKADQNPRPLGNGQSLGVAVPLEQSGIIPLGNRRVAPKKVDPLGTSSDVGQKPQD